MPITGQPTRRRGPSPCRSSRPCTSPSEPPKTVKSWLKTQTWRPSIVPWPVTTASAQRPVAVHPEIGRAVADEGVELLEGAGVEQLLDALARRELALRVLLLDGRPLGVRGLAAQLLELRELLRVAVGRALGHRAPDPSASGCAAALAPPRERAVAGGRRPGRAAPERAARRARASIVGSGGAGGSARARRRGAAAGAPAGRAGRRLRRGLGLVPAPRAARSAARASRSRSARARRCRASSLSQAIAPRAGRVMRISPNARRAAAPAAGLLSWPTARAPTSRACAVPRPRSHGAVLALEPRFLRSPRSARPVLPKISRIAPQTSPSVQRGAQRLADRGSRLPLAAGGLARAPRARCAARSPSRAARNAAQALRPARARRPGSTRRMSSTRTSSSRRSG